MNIGIDFDDTFTADEDLWADFIRLAQRRGHKDKGIRIDIWIDDSPHSIVNGFK